MIIRKAQIGVLEQAMVQSFEKEMGRHLRDFSPNHCDVIGDSGVHTVIQHGMKKAGTYGFSNRGPVRLYLDLMFMFGSEFDTDPQLPWAAGILRDVDVSDQMERAERLHSKSLEYSDAVAGPNFEYAKEAFARARRVRYQ